MSFTKLWQAEQEVDLELAYQLISQQFPQLAPLHIDALGTGWDNIVYTVNQMYAFRFPRRAIALPLMQTEWQLLDALAPLLSLFIPRPVFDGRPGDLFSWPFAGYRLVIGHEACMRQLSPQQRTEMIPQLAHSLKTLHQLPPEWYQPLNLPADQMQKVNLAQRKPQTYERLQQAVELGLMSSDTAYRDFLRRLPSETPADRTQCLVHGDLYLRHLIVNDQNQLSGIIDWGDAHIGDPATDLSLVYAFLPPLSRAAFWEVYGPVDSLTQDLARFRALFHSLALLLYAQDIADTDLLREAQLSLNYLLE